MCPDSVCLRIRSGRPRILRRRAFSRRFVDETFAFSIVERGRAPPTMGILENSVRDLAFTLVTIGFFLVAIGYLRGCERLK
jgi:hypothetical protein